ncbi:MAG: hypothetical protein HKN91_11395 [Acidimicrobiia bacterium]|nr:hypothetical protein [Acidimicrobiia bacterium]
MQLQPIIYTTDTATAVDWYTKMLNAPAAYSSEAWTAIPVGDGTLGIHHVEARPKHTYVEISLVSKEPLEGVIARLDEVGIEPEEGIKEQPFGRSVLFRDPDGAPVQINEHAH